MEEGRRGVKLGDKMQARSQDFGEEGGAIFRPNHLKNLTS